MMKLVDFENGAAKSRAAMLRVFVSAVVLLGALTAFTTELAGQTAGAGQQYQLSYSEDTNQKNGTADANYVYDTCTRGSIFDAVNCVTAQMQHADWDQVSDDGKTITWRKRKSSADGTKSSSVATAKALLTISVRAILHHSQSDKTTWVTIAHEDKWDINQQMSGDSKGLCEQDRSEVTAGLSKWSKPLTKEQVNELYTKGSIDLLVPEPFASLRKLSRPNVVLKVEADCKPPKERPKATIRFVRQIKKADQTPNSADRFESVDLVFMPEKIMVEVQTEKPVELDSIPLVVRINEQALSSNCSRTVLAQRVTSTVFRTQSIEVVPGNDPTATRPPGGIFLSASELDVLRASEAKGAPVDVDPATAKATVSRTPARYASLWKEALLKAAEFDGVKVSGDRPLPNEEATTISNVSLISFQLNKTIPGGKQRVWVLRKLGADVTGNEPIVYSTTIHLGDHAAAILLKKVFIEMMKDFAKGLDEIPLDYDDDVLRFYKGIAPYMKDGRHPLANIEVTDPRQLANLPNMTPFDRVRVPFKEMFEAKYLSEDQRIKATREAYFEMRNRVAYAINKAENTPDSDIKELLKLTGIGFDRAVERLTPRLVKLEDVGNPPRQYWVVDNQARGWVNGLKNTANAIADQENQSALDTQVAFAAACLVAPFLGAETVIGMLVKDSVTIVNLNMALDQERETAEREDRYRFALGASNVLGNEILDEAERQRTPKWAQWLNRAGLALSGADVITALTAVSKAEAAARGAELLQHVQKGGLKALEQLGSKDRAILLRFLREAEIANATECEYALTDAERDAQRVMDQLSEEARLNPPKPEKVKVSDSIPKAASTKAARDVQTVAKDVEQLGPDLDRQLAAANDAKKAAEASKDKLAIKAAKDKVGDVGNRKEILDELNHNGYKMTSLSEANRRLLEDDLKFLADPTRGLTEEQIRAAKNLVLEKYGGDWHALKEAFNGTPPQVSKLDMYKAVTWRKQVVDAMLEKAMGDVEKAYGVKFGRPKAFGSTNLTSDYDVSIYGERAEKVVRKFNQLFREEFGNLESGTFFDTNVYTDPVYGLFEGKLANGTSLQLEPLQMDELRQFMYDQMATRKYLPDREWQAHRAIMEKEAPEGTRRIVRWVLDEAESGNRSARQLLKDKLASLQAKGMNVNHANTNLRASNEIYEELLENIDKLRAESKRLERLGTTCSDAKGFVKPFEGVDPRIKNFGGGDYQAALKKIEQLSQNPTAENLKEIQRIKNEWQELFAKQIRSQQGMALYFASEAYQTEGAIAHVVGELQEGGRKITTESLLSDTRTGKLPADQYLDSFYENRANMFKELEHLRGPGETFTDGRYAAAKAAKYFIRELDAAYQAGIDLKSVMSEDLIKLTVGVDGARNSLENVEQLLKATKIEGQQVEAAQFIQKVEEASNKLSARLLDKSSIKKASGAISDYLIDTGAVR